MVMPLFNGYANVQVEAFWSFTAFWIFFYLLRKIKKFSAKEMCGSYFLLLTTSLFWSRSKEVAVRTLRWTRKSLFS